MEAMTYEEFRAAFLRSMKESGPPNMGFQEEKLDLVSLDRTFGVFMEPVGGQRSKPFHATAAISWRWSALQTHRGILPEEDTLRELLGDVGEDIEPGGSRILRVDIKLSASTMVGHPVPMPSTAKWAEWTRETLGRLESGEALLPEDDVEETDDGRLAILAWKGDPRIEADCSPAGGVRLHAVKLDAFQLINLPTNLDDPDRHPGPHPAEQLDAMFARVKAALYAWMDALDHLVP
jgi:hypothetical protein